MVMILTPEKLADGGEDDYPENILIDNINVEYANYKTIWEEANEIFLSYDQYIKKLIAELQCTVTNQFETFSRSEEYGGRYSKEKLL